MFDVFANEMFPTLPLEPEPIAAPDPDEVAVITDAPVIATSLAADTEPEPIALPSVLVAVIVESLIAIEPTED